MRLTAHQPPGQRTIRHALNGKPDSIIGELIVEAGVSPLIQNTAPAESFTRFLRYLQFANDYVCQPFSVLEFSRMQSNSQAFKPEF